MLNERQHAGLMGICCKTKCNGHRLDLAGNGGSRFSLNAALGKSWAFASGRLRVWLRIHTVGQFQSVRIQKCLSNTRRSIEDRASNEASEHFLWQIS